MIHCRKPEILARSKDRYKQTATIVAMALSGVALGADQNSSLHNPYLSCSVHAHDGSYEIQAHHTQRPVLRAIVAAQIDHQWVKSTDFPKHEISRAGFDDELGHGELLTVTSTGLSSRPDLVYVLRLYDSLPYGDIKVEVRNGTRKAVTVQAIRSVEALGENPIDLGGRESRDRVLSDSFSENRPALKIYDLGKVPEALHRGMGSQLIYNLDSGRSLFVGALTSERFLTISRLQAQATGSEPRIKSFVVDSTGTTEIQTPPIFVDAPIGEDRIELSLPLAPGSNMASERLMLAVSGDYYSQLEAYGAAIRQLHHARVSGPPMLGWWSWTAYYREMSEGKLLTNAQWLTQHLKDLGYDHFHIDDGYEYAAGEYTTVNATRFPRGMRQLTNDIRGLGLQLNLWTGPFYFGDRSWVYEHHKDWLVHNARGLPIRVWRKGKSMETQDIYVLDTTHPGAQKYLRKTYQTLVREWGIRYFKLDYMDSTAIEGYYHRPHTTALEAERIGLKIIREAVGDDVVLVKDGSPMLNAVGLVDQGRTSQDTAHTLYDTREAATGIAARYYMHRNFFVNDPDAFNISRQMVGRRIKAPLTLNEAQVSIVLAAVSGGTYQIGDDLPTLGADPERLALVTNPNLLQMAKLGRASKPLDLMTYRPEDEMPSIFFLRESGRQSMLAVFNWTEQPRSHALKLSELGVSGSHIELHDALAEDRPVALDGETIVLNEQPAHSVRLLKIIDGSRAAVPPAITAQVPTEAKIDEQIQLSAAAREDGLPVTTYHWDFGDGVVATGASPTHTYTLAGEFKISLTGDGVDGVPAQKTFSIAVRDQLKFGSATRYVEPTDSAAAKLH